MNPTEIGLWLFQNVIIKFQKRSKLQDDYKITKHLAQTVQCMCNTLIYDQIQNTHQEKCIPKSILHMLRNILIMYFWPKCGYHIPFIIFYQELIFFSLTARLLIFMLRYCSLSLKTSDSKSACLQTNMFCLTLILCMHHHSFTAVSTNVLLYSFRLSLWQRFKG